MKSALVFVSLLCVFMVLGTACSYDRTEETEKPKETVQRKTVINILQGKVEIADQLKALTDQYTKEHPNVVFQIETVGFGADSSGALKAAFATGKAPDLFTSEGYQNALTWKNKLEDLSDQPWVEDAYPQALTPMTIDGRVYGQPVNLEGYGFIYNKTLFRKAGISVLPRTFSELEIAAKKLQAVGITPFSVGYAEWWVLANHGLNVPFAYAQADNPHFISGLSKGTSKMEDNPYFDDYFKLLDLTIQYGNKNPLTTDYNTELTQFANGETAMIQQGNWVQPLLDKLNPTMEVGILPMALTDDPQQADKLMVDVPSSWVINKGAPPADKEAAKDFLQWMVSSKAGQTALIKDFKYIPAFPSIKASSKDIGSLGAELQRYIQTGKTYSWQFMKYPNGASQEFSSAIQSYISNQKDREETEQTLDTIWKKLKNGR